MKPGEEVFEALASTTRMKILDALREKRLECDNPGSCDLSERCCNVGELVDRLGLTQPTVSHHLKELRRAGLITSEKDGRTLYCSINDEKFEELCRFIQSFCCNGGDSSCN
ncbi:MAG: ArsR/SmtB family transcription factor [bacterium]